MGGLFDPHIDSSSDGHVDRIFGVFVRVGWTTVGERAFALLATGRFGVVVGRALRERSGGSVSLALEFVDPGAQRAVLGGELFDECGEILGPRDEIEDLRDQFVAVQLFEFVSIFHLDRYLPISHSF